MWRGAGRSPAWREKDRCALFAEYVLTRVVTFFGGEAGDGSSITGGKLDIYSGIYMEIASPEWYSVSRSSYIEQARTYYHALPFHFQILPSS